MQLLLPLHSMGKGKREYETINERGTKLLRATELLSPLHTKIVPTDQEFIFHFISKTGDQNLSEGGKELKMRLKSLLNY